MKKFLIYTDGSYCKGSTSTHGGIVFVPMNGEPDARRIHVFTTIPQLVSMWNVGGEILAAWCAIYSVMNEVKKLNEQTMDTYELELVYDYTGIGAWPMRVWKKRNSAGSEWYYQQVEAMKKEVPNLKIKWTWIKGHTGKDRWNTDADAVASYDMQHCEINNIPICNMDEALQEMFK